MMSIRRSYLCTDCITVLDRPYSCTLDVRIGSKPDERGHRPGGPHLGVKQTKSGAKQTLPLEGLLSGVERSDRRHGPNSRL